MRFVSPKHGHQGQAMANFTTELTPNEEIKILQDPSLAIGESPVTSRLAPIQDLYMDSSSNDGGCGAGLILSSLKPECLMIKYNTIKIRGFQ